MQGGKFKIVHIVHSVLHYTVIYKLSCTTTCLITPILVLGPTRFSVYSHL